jgi:aminotransferase
MTTLSATPLFEPGFPLPNPQGIKLEGEAGYQRCARCIMDTTDPEIVFDADGVCNHCLKVAEWMKSWNPQGDKARLDQLMDRIKADGKGRDYDMIMGLSGGVDSSYVAHIAQQYGLRTLVIHCDTGWNSELAVQNIESIVSTAGFDLVTHVVDWEEMQDVQHAFFKSGVPNQDIPQDHAISAVFYGYARKLQIPWSLSGSNLACESILPRAWGYDARDSVHLKAIHKKFGKRPMRDFPVMSYLSYGLRYQVLGGMKVAKPLDLVPYNKSEAMKTLEKVFNWRYYGGKHYESRFTKFFQGYYLPTKWGYDKRLAHLSSLVVSNQITREEALQEFRTGSLPVEDIVADKDYMARKLDISLDEFEALMRVPNTLHTSYPVTSPLVMQGLRAATLAWRMIGRLKSGPKRA